MNRQRRGFTLVELLVVIAIIGVLVALLLPAVQAARAAARTSTCKSQMRQLSIAAIQYCDAHDGEFPKWWHVDDATGAGSWVFTLAPYLENVDEIRICPEDRLLDERRKARGTSYCINDYLSSRGDDHATNLRQLNATSRTILMFEGADEFELTEQNPIRDPNDPYGLRKREHIHATQWYSDNAKELDIVMFLLRRDLQIDRHQGGSNYAYVDGHVELIPSSQIEQWVDEGFEFAKPQ
jgi:prepilin-type N-terminal cleavage/methylation domain-containing protein/prepilin-type processing-associated H-X9-DG protein